MRLDYYCIRNFNFLKILRSGGVLFENYWGVLPPLRPPGSYATEEYYHYFEYSTILSRYSI